MVVAERSPYFFPFFFQAEDGIRDFCLSRGLGDVYKRQVLLRGPPRRQQRRAPARQLHPRARKMNDLVRDEIWVTVPVTRGPRVFVRTVELSELCLSLIHI